MVTLKDVGLRVGVSPKTVSRVVNDDPAVNEETRRIVQEAIRELDYVPDLTARMMRTATSSVIGLMTDVVATTPFSVDIVRGVQDALSDHGRMLQIATTGGDPVMQRNYWRMLKAHKVGGLIFATMYHRAVDLGTEDYGRPIVLVNCFPVRRDQPSIVPDDEHGGYMQAAHLLRLGHRRIGIVSLNPAIRATLLRSAGHRTAFAEAGATYDPALDRPGFVGPVETETLRAYEVARDMLLEPDRPTAILCGNDRVALQVMTAAAHLGLSVPGDLSVIGFDDMTLISQSVRPALTTVALPYPEMGRLAVDLICSEVRAHNRQILVPCTLVERDSCRPLV